MTCPTSLENLLLAAWLLFCIQTRGDFRGDNSRRLPSRVDTVQTETFRNLCTKIPFHSIQRTLKLLPTVVMRHAMWYGPYVLFWRRWHNYLCYLDRVCSYVSISSNQRKNHPWILTKMSTQTFVCGALQEYLPVVSWLVSAQEHFRWVDSSM